MIVLDAAGLLIMQQGEKGSSKVAQVIAGFRISVHPLP